MKPKALMLLAVALVCGLVAMMGVQQAMSGNRSGQVETRKVFVAAKDLKPGIPLTKEDVILKEMASAAAPKDAITLPEQFEERALKAVVLAGEVISQRKLHEKGQGYGTSTQIPKGMRVMTITADTTTTHSGMLNPGDRVDVFVTFKKGNSGKQKMETKVLLEAVDVFATEAKTRENTVEKDTKEKTIKSVSLLLTPEQVPYVKLAQAKGTLSLMLRNPLDDEVVNTKRVDEALLEELNDSVGSDGQMMFGSEYPTGETLPTAAPLDVAPDGPVDITPMPTETVQDFTQRNSQPDPNAAGQTPAAPAAPPVDPNAWTVQVYRGNTVQAVSVIDEKKNEASTLSGWLGKFLEPK